MKTVQMTENNPFNLTKEQLAVAKSGMGYPPEITKRIFRHLKDPKKELGTNERHRMASFR